jgi:hypothetical protein
VCLDTGWDRDPRRGPAIDVFINLGGDRCRNRRQRPLGSLPSTSSLTSVVATAGPTGSTPPGGPPSLSSSTSVVAIAGPTGSAPQEPAIDVCFKLDGGRCRTRRQCPPGGPTIDIFLNLGGGRCRTRQQHPLGGPTIIIFFNLGGGRYWTHQQRTPGGPPSTSSSTSVMDTTRSTDSAS